MTIKTMNIVVTGSAGFLGSPLCFDLLSSGHKVVGIDNYITSSDINTKKLQELFKDKFNFHKIDLSKDINDLNEIFRIHKPNCVVHFAALKSVNESEKNPQLYWENNLYSTENIINSMKSFNCKKIVYSSSAAVYGNQAIQPIKEDATLCPISVYAKTKVACEELIKDSNKKFGIDGISLRYFNPIGSHKSGIFKDELKNDNGSLMNEVLRVAQDNNKILNIYGKDYGTIDGTCERDYIHITDLLNAHEKTINFINSFDGYEVFNVGTGKAVSIIGLINTFVKQNKIKINYKFVNKRIGDVESSYADVSKIESILNWKSKKTLKDMVKDSWKAYSY